MNGTTPDDAPAGRHESLWLATSPGTDYEPLADGLGVDVAVVGGGIAGVTAAAKLADAGQDVALLERDRIVASVTGHTTAKLTALHELPFGYLESQFDEETASLYAEANQAAVEDVTETVDREGVDCGFTRATAYTYVTDSDQRRRVRREAGAARRAGLSASFVESTELPYDVDSAVAVDDQAHFHPRRYLLALAERVVESGSHVFEETTVTDVRPGEPCTVVTDRGSLRAEDVVVATHFPIYDRGLYFSRLTPRRSYVLAARIEGESPTGMYYRSADPYFSIRPTTRDEGDLVLFGGQNHRTGAGDEADRYRRLERTVRERFDVDEIAYRWSTQDYTSVDGVPFVGTAGPGVDHVYVATGFGGWGMTNGTAAGIVLRDLILGRESEWASVFNPERLTVRASAGSMARHNVHAVRHLVRDRVDRPPGIDAASLVPGEGDVFEVDGDKVAVSRDADGELHAVSAICTHMGCVVHWNDGEGSWDCPCHGSRFAADGDVLDTPANEALQPHDVDVGRLAGDLPMSPPRGGGDVDRGDGGSGHDSSGHDDPGHHGPGDGGPGDGGEP